MDTSESDLAAIFSAALAKQSPDERAAYVELACAGDDDLRRRVEQLLDAYPEVGSFLENKTPGAVAAADEPIREGPGTVMGPYKLLQEIGEGGFGVVFMAEQTQPVQRKVAFKIIKAGMDTRQVIARFEAERQALALMDHPNIAKVFDAGTTDSGRPYFVMELVKGVPVTTYCDEKQLTLKERLELFIPICHAVQHAHQKGIIHRDLKPTNLLVAEYDNEAVPKVIDFGVAKATAQKLTERTMFTQFGQLIGTLEYMSPEQAKLNQLDIDTRSDIYSLGVLLYELLTSSTPFDRRRLQSAAFDETLRIIREEEPPKPSTKLSSADTLPLIAANRHTEAARLRKQVRGELDWIVMKALEKNRNRRYETASSFAADVKRYLSDEPVHACPPSAWYRFRKLAHRNKALFAVAGLTLFFVMLFGGGVGWQVREHAARRAGIELAVAEAIREARLFQKQGNWPEAMAAAKRAERLRDAAEISDGLRQNVTELYAALAQEGKDRQMVARLEEIRMVEGEPAPHQSESRQQRAFRLYAEAFRDYGIDTETLDVAGAAALVNQSAIRAQLLSILDNWAWITADRKVTKRLRQISDLADPDPLGMTHQMRRALAKKDRAALLNLAESAAVEKLPPTTLADLGTALLLMPAPSEAVKLLRRAQHQYPGDFWINRQLATALLNTKPPQPAEALRYLNAAWAVRPGNAYVCLNIATVLEKIGNLDDAIAGYHTAARLKPDYAAAWYGAGELHALRGEWKQAIANSMRAVEVQPDEIFNWYRLGVAHLAVGDVQAHRRVCRDVLVRFGTTKSPAIASRVLYTCLSAPDVVADLPQLITLGELAIPVFKGNERVLAAARYRAGQYAEALKTFDQSASQSYQARAWDWCFRSMCHQRLGDAAQARLCLDKAVEWTEKADGVRKSSGGQGPQMWVHWYEPVEVQHLRREAEALIDRANR